MKRTNNKSVRGFSLIEVLIVLAILVLILLIAFHFYQKYLGSARDGKRKSDLQELMIILEDFYNDHGCYPRPTQICYDAVTNDDNPCHICGEEANPIPQYRLPCNPNHPTEKYLYEVDNSSCPKWYRIFSKLYLPDDSGPCPYSLCGPTNGLGGYDYGVSSPNVGFVIPNTLWEFLPGGSCSDCGEITDCERRLLEGVEGIFVSLDACCAERPEATNCIWNGFSIAGDCTTCRGSQQYCRVFLSRFYHGPDWLQECCADNPAASSCQ